MLAHLRPGPGDVRRVEEWLLLGCHWGFSVALLGWQLCHRVRGKQCPWTLVGMSCCISNGSRCLQKTTDHY